MTIDPTKLKAAAEHLEWVLQQYPDEPTVQGMLESMRPLIEDAKTGRVKTLIGRGDVPLAYAVAEGRYAPYMDPDVEGAYYDFSAELRGGRDEQEQQLIEDTKAMIDRRKRHGQP